MNDLIKITDFLRSELSDWDDFKLDFVSEDESFYVTIKNDLWNLEKEMRFCVEDGNVCLYMSYENWQRVDFVNYNKFFWIELLGDN